MASKQQVLDAMTTQAAQNKDQVTKLQAQITALQADKAVLTAENTALKSQLASALTTADLDEILAAIPAIFG